MALSYDEKIEKEMQKIAELKRKRKAEFEKNVLAVGRKIVNEIPDITVENFETALAQYVAKGLSDSDRSSLMLGRLMKQRMPQCFANNDFESYKNNINKIAEFIEKND